MMGNPRTQNAAPTTTFRYALIFKLRIPLLFASSWSGIPIPLLAALGPAEKSPVLRLHPPFSFESYARRRVRCTGSGTFTASYLITHPDIATYQSKYKGMENISFMAEVGSRRLRITGHKSYGIQPAQSNPKRHDLLYGYKKPAQFPGRVIMKG
jgi:hypothetical protein